MVAAAIERGFASLGFSDHGFAPHDGAAMSLEVEKEYRAEIKRLKEKYAGEIEIALGYEHDWSMPQPDYELYEYVIESVHFFDDWLVKSIDHSKDQFAEIYRNRFEGDPYRMTREYFETVCRSIEGTQAEIIGHIELIRKFNEVLPLFDTEDPRYTGPAREVVRLAAERGKIIEINTGAMSRGYRSAPYPDLSLLRELNRLGGRITVTSDCHRAEWIDFAFDQAYELAREAGFKEIWLWKDGGFKPFAL